MADLSEYGLFFLAQDTIGDLAIILSAIISGYTSMIFR